MIKNIIFDIGNVLAKFRWRELFLEIGIEGDAFDQVARATVLSKYWLEYDRSALSDEEIIEKCVSLAPEYEKEIRLYFLHIGEICVTFPYAQSWIEELKRKGFHVYLLSNFSRTAFLKHMPNMPFLEIVDGKVISYEVKSVKPEKGIFDALEEKYHISPKESVFIDDTEINVEAASSFAYHGIVFQSKEQTMRELAFLLSREG